NLKGTVEYIGDSAFKDCTAIKDTYFLQGAKNIGAWAFWGASVPGLILRNVYSIGEAAFYNSTITDITIWGNHLKTISDFAFFNCNRIQNINICNSVKTIGKQAFANCDRLVDVTLPASVKKIDTGAFMECDRLKTVKTVNVEEVKDHAFFNCPKMIKFETNYMDTALGDYSMGFCYFNSLTKNTGFTIYAPAGGVTEAYANSNNLLFVAK
ncbi:MAG TPA: leucine-rich repeat domain-containing protein, partial [Ruminococcus sp.]|nr:leucine-rich repeat domain-containing protein [Ruminococcus sp.]